MLQEALWTLICLADDDRLCKEAVNTSGALPAIVPLLGVDPFDAPINEFVCLPALAARALRVLAEDCSCPTSVQSDGNNKSNGSNTEYNSWQEQAVPYLVKMLSTAAGNSSGKETADEQSQQLLTRSTSNLNQRLRRSSVWHVRQAICTGH